MIIKFVDLLRRRVPERLEDEIHTNAGGGTAETSLALTVKTSSLAI